MKKIIFLSMAVLLFTACNQNIKTVDCDEFEKVAESGNITLIDVRSASEYLEGHISGSLNVDVNQPSFRENVGQSELLDTVAVYCRSGHRSMNAARILARQGYFVYNLEGGIQAWEKAGKPLE